MTTIDYSTSCVTVGEKVLLLLNYIKAEKHDDFEPFYTEHPCISGYARSP